MRKHLPVMAQGALFMTTKPYRKWLKNCYGRGIRTVKITEGVVYIEYGALQGSMTKIGYGHRSEAFNAELVFKSRHRSF